MNVLKCGVLGEGRFQHGSPTHQKGHLRLLVGMQTHKVRVHLPAFAVTVAIAAATTSDHGGAGGSHTHRAAADDLLDHAEYLVYGESIGLYRLGLFQNSPYPQLTVWVPFVDTEHRASLLQENARTVGWDDNLPLQFEDAILKGYEGLR